MTASRSILSCAALTPLSLTPPFHPFAPIFDGILPFGADPRQHHSVLVSLLHPERSTLSGQDVVIGQGATDLDYSRIKLLLESLALSLQILFHRAAYCA
jgi:hypothetical protein